MRKTISDVLSLRYDLLILKSVKPLAGATLSIVHVTVSPDGSVTDIVNGRPEPVVPSSNMVKVVPPAGRLSK